MTIQKRSRGPRRQHWVPRFYLRYFATPESRDTDNPLVWVFSKDFGEPLLTSVGQIAAQSFLYSPKDRFGNLRWDVEMRLADLEGVMSSGWSSFANELVDFHDDDVIRKAVALFVSILHLRHPKRLAEVETLHESLVKAYDSFPKDAHGRPDIGAIEHDGVFQPFDNSSWYEYKAAGPNEKKKMFVDSILQNATHCAEILLKKRWYVVFSKSPVFITTDDPVTVVNPNRKVFGLATSETKVFFPLSPTRVLIMDDRHEQPDGLYHPLLDDVRDSGFFNLLAWKHSARFMISHRHTDSVCAELLAWRERVAPNGF